jgi:hypothetical protein
MLLCFLETYMNTPRFLSAVRRAVKVVFLQWLGASTASFPLAEEDALRTTLPSLHTRKNVTRHNNWVGATILLKLSEKLCFCCFASSFRYFCLPHFFLSFFVFLCIICFTSRKRYFYKPDNHHCEQYQIIITVNSTRQSSLWTLCSSEVRILITYI